jgi:hypothetical protein
LKQKGKEKETETEIEGRILRGKLHLPAGRGRG